MNKPTTISSASAAETVTFPGMGSILHKDGTFFRVWAPHAHKVFVTGEFNDWNTGSLEMLQEGNGYWGINVPGARAGEQYKYFLHTDQGHLYKNDPYAREVTGSNGNSLIHDTSFDWTDDNFPTPDWNKLVIYELHVGTFNRKDHNRPGTFYDVMDKLSYLKELGINAIEIMPPAEFPGGISWGYNPSHPYAIEQDYGGVKGFKTLINEAHKQGIAIILDIVYNHFGPGDLDIWRFDGWSENNGGGIYFYQDWRKKTPWGDSRPDYGRSEVRQYIRDNAIMWLEEYHIDGLRTDAISFIRNVNGDDNPQEDIPDGWSLMQWINKEVQQRFPWKITIAEDMKCNEWITKPQGAGGEGFGSQWDAAFVYPVRRALSAAKDADRDMDELTKAILYRYNNNAFERVIYTESHDEVANGKVRLTEEIAPDDSANWFAKKRSILGAVLVFTSPGIPMIFQGQELLENGFFSDNDPIDWSRTEGFNGIVKLYRDLVHLRTNHEGYTKGLTGQGAGLLYVNETEKIVAFHRWDKKGSNDSVVVVLNLADKDHNDFIIPFPEPGLWKLRFNSDWKGYDATFGNEFAWDTATLECDIHDDKFDARVNLAPYSAVIYSKD